MKQYQSEKEKNLFIAPGAFVFGDVNFGQNDTIWFNAVIRADQSSVTLGDNVNIQDNCTVHVSPNCPVMIGNDVTIGHNAIIHGCTIGDNTLIGMGSIIMNNSVIGKNCIVAAGAIVTERMEIPDNSLVMGSPAKIRRQVTEAEIEKNHTIAGNYVREAKEYQ